MAIALELIDIIVPIATIKTKYPGGWAQCLADHAEDIRGGAIWYDERLFRDGAMAPDMAAAILKQWESKGFELTRVHNNETVWQDVCVVEPVTLAPTRPCEWLAVDKANSCAYLAWLPQGEVMSRKHFMK